MTPAALAVETQVPEQVMCACGQLIARRLRNHIEPIGAPLTLDSKGRPVIVCPKCGRFTVVRREVSDEH